MHRYTNNMHDLSSHGYIVPSPRLANICIPVGKIYWAEGPVGIKYVCVKGETREKGRGKGKRRLKRDIPSAQSS